MKHIKTLTGKTFKGNYEKRAVVVNARHLVSQHVRHPVQ